MNYKWFISTARTGTRLKDLTQHTNKALLEINGKAVISYIIEKIDPDIPVIIAPGFKNKRHLICPKCKTARWNKLKTK